MSVKFSYSDNVVVSRAELYIDGGLAATSTIAPFTMKWDKRASRTSKSVDWRRGVLVIPEIERAELGKSCFLLVRWH